MALDVHVLNSDAGRPADWPACQFEEAVHAAVFSGGPISWPRCQRVEGRGQPSLLVEEEVARAIHNESATALCYWWDVSEPLVVARGGSPARHNA
jgi:hypothetical protein